MRPKPNAWTPEEERWLREVYPHHLNRDISAMHAERFPDAPHRTQKAINSRARVYGLRKAEGFNRNAGRRTVWTDERVEWLRAYAPGHDIYEIIDEFERVHGIRTSVYQMKNAKQRYGARSGTNAGQFQKGQEPASKGRTWDELGISEQSRERMRRGQFKKGGVPMNGAAIPIGTERTTKDGYVQVKVSMLSPRTGMNECWRLKHNVVWEQANGMPVPPHHMVVFADHDKANFDPDNLVLVPRALWAVISHKHIAYWDAESLRTAMLIAQVDRARYAAQCRPRKCRTCGGEFSPRHPNQQTCDACLGHE